LKLVTYINEKLNHPELKTNALHLLVLGVSGSLSISGNILLPSYEAGVAIHKKVFLIIPQ